MSLEFNGKKKRRERFRGEQEKGWVELATARERYLLLLQLGTSWWLTLPDRLARSRLRRPAAEHVCKEVYGMG